MTTLRYIKYKTDETFHYLYDLGTGRIIRVNKEIYNLIDDYFHLPQDCFEGKYREEYDKDLSLICGEIESLQEMGFLSDIQSLKQVEATHVVNAQEIVPIDQFIQQNCQSLVLELTEECNLRCEYCCYDDQYAGFRSHGTAVMELEVAKLAIMQFLKRAVPHAGIGFYGGEPLLQFELIKHLVTLVEDSTFYSTQKPIQWFITTNGTLLDDDKIHFLVKHGFIVTVSLDGPKELHDRYRVFRSSGFGTFDLVKKNLDRFTELYPGYTKLGTNVTISSPYNFVMVNEFLKIILDLYPLIRVSFVVKHEKRNEINVVYSGINCFSSISVCRKQSPFLPFSSDERAEYVSMSQDYLRELSKNPTEARSVLPLFSHLIDLSLYNCHTRNVASTPPQNFLQCHCLPGYHKLFCNSSGQYYLCEKVVTNKKFIIGDVWNGVDVPKSLQIMREFQTLTNCVCCEANKTCSLCMASVNFDENGNVLREDFDRQCKNERNSFRYVLKIYTEIMRKNRNAIEMMDSGATDFLKDIHVVSIKPGDADF